MRQHTWPSSYHCQNAEPFSALALTALAATCTEHRCWARHLALRFCRESLHTAQAASMVTAGCHELTWL